MKCTVQELEWSIGELRRFRERGRTLNRTMKERLSHYLVPWSRTLFHCPLFPCKTYGRQLILHLVDALLEVELIQAKKREGLN